MVVSSRPSGQRPLLYLHDAGIIFTCLCSARKKNIFFVSVLGSASFDTPPFHSPSRFSSRSSPRLSPRRSPRRTSRRPDASVPATRTRFRRRRGGEKRVTFSRGIFCQRGTTDCLIVPCIFVGSLFLPSGSILKRIFLPPRLRDSATGCLGHGKPSPFCTSILELSRGFDRSCYRLGRKTRCL